MRPTPAPGWPIRYGAFIFRYRNFVFPAVLVALLGGLTPPPPASGGSVGLGPWDWLDGVGLLAVVAGAVLRVTVVGLAYIKRGGVDKAVYADRLVTNGMFGHCRNPLYVGNLFILGGLFVIHNHPLVYILGGSFFVLTYIAMVANEERYLQSKFGEEFLAYQARVPRWGVKLHGLRTTFQEMSFHWSRVVDKEYGTLLVWTVAVCGMLAEEALLRSDRGFRSPAVSGPVLFALAAFVAALAIRTAKKRRARTARRATAGPPENAD